MQQASDDKKILEVSRGDMGRADTLRYNVNYFVVEESYDRAIEELENYKKISFDLPGYQEKIEPYLNHCIDLVHAIRAKKGFSKNLSLTRSKQQEIRDTIRLHYDELQHSFKKMEQIKHQLSLEDMKSTVWPIRALVYSLGTILSIVFLTEMLSDTAGTFYVVFDVTVDNFVNWIFTLIK